MIQGRRWSRIKSEESVVKDRHTEKENCMRERELKKRDKARERE